MKNKRGYKYLNILLFLLIIITIPSVYAGDNGLVNKTSSVLCLKSSYKTTSLLVKLKPLVGQGSTKGVIPERKLGFLEKRASSSNGKNSSLKSEKPFYKRYLLPIAITIGAGTATYMLYSVRSN